MIERFLIGLASGGITAWFMVLFLGINLTLTFTNVLLLAMMAQSGAVVGVALGVILDKVKAQRWLSTGTSPVSPNGATATARQKETVTS